MDLSPVMNALNDGIALVSALDQTAPMTFRVTKPKAVEALRLAASELAKLKPEIDASEQATLKAIEKLGLVASKLEIIVSASMPCPAGCGRATIAAEAIQQINAS